MALSTPAFANSKLLGESGLKVSPHRLHLYSTEALCPISQATPPLFSLEFQVFSSFS
jgi:hypothetical protein